MHEPASAAPGYTLLIWEEQEIRKIIQSRSSPKIIRTAFLLLKVQQARLIWDSDDIVIGNEINILSLNIEVTIAPNSDYLARLPDEIEVDVVTLQETHLSPHSPPSSSQITGYSLIARVDRPQYGIATYSREPTWLQSWKKSLKT